jgi:hypothetical protein
MLPKRPAARRDSRHTHDDANLRELVIRKDPVTVGLLATKRVF